MTRIETTKAGLLDALRDEFGDGAELEKAFRRIDQDAWRTRGVYEAYDPYLDAFVVAHP